MNRNQDALRDLELTGERLTLRRWQPADAPRVHDVVNAGGMREFLNLPDPYTPDEALAYVTGFGHEGRDDGTGLGSAMVERASGRVVGACAVRLGAPGADTDPEIGYWVASDARGHGYAAEATRLLARVAFSLGHPRVQLACDAQNLASARTALAAGFRFEGISRLGITGPGHDPQRPARRGDLARFARLAEDPDEAVPPAFPPLPAGGLSDGVVTLRVMSPDDATGLVETEHDAESVRWNFRDGPHPRADLESLARRSGLDWLVGSSARSAIVDVATGSFAGHINLRFSGPPMCGGLGYAVHPDFRGRGYTSRALRLLAPWAFSIGYGRLELGAKADNIASQRAAARAGFDQDGIRLGRLRNGDGTFGDEVRFALLNPDLAAART